MKRNYFIHGLRVESSVALPCLPLEDVSHKPDVRVTLGEIPDQLEKPSGFGVCFQCSHGEFLLKLPGLGKCLVQNGNSIVLSPEQDTEALRPYLLGSCMAALAHQRGLVALHAACVDRNGSCLLFLGASGAGKSTLAAAFSQRGWDVFSDDLTVVHCSASGYGEVYAGPQRIRLDQRSTLALGFPKAKVPESEFEGKAEISIKSPSSPRKIDKIYLIGPWNKPEFSMGKQNNLDKVKSLIVHTFRTRYLKGLGSRREHLRQVTGFSGSVELWGIKRPAFDFRLEELIEKIESTF